MPLFLQGPLAIIISLAVVAHAQPVRNPQPAIQAITNNPQASGNNCPSDWTNFGLNESSRCCYGTMIVDSNDERYCCVRTAKTSASAFSATPSGCVTVVPFTASDYSNVVSTASASATQAAATGTSTDAAMALPTADVAVIGGMAVVVAVFVL